MPLLMMHVYAPTSVIALLHYYQASAVQSLWLVQSACSDAGVESS